MSDPVVRTRFAPSPTGYLHIGGLRTALYAYLFARQKGGRFILRIEDTDLERYVPGAVDIILRTMKDAGLLYDEGPDVGGDYGPYIQSERKDTYLKYAKQLVDSGGAYYCFCTKQRLKAMYEGGATKYDKACLRLGRAEAERRAAAGEPYVIRQNIPETGTSAYHDLVFGHIAVDNKELEDNVLIKSDGMPTYNFANVVDDHLMAVNYVIRGVEYLSSTPKYNLLYRGLGWETPQYMHLQPIMRDAAHKLSKRYGDASYEDFVARGFLPAAIVNYIALLGWSPKDDREKFTLDELVRRFSVEGLSKSPSIFDENKLRWLNAQYIKELPPEEFHARALPFYAGHAYLEGYDLKYLSGLLHGRAEVLSDVGPLTAFLTEFEGFDPALFVNEKWKTDPALAKAMLPRLIDLAKNTDPQAIGEALNAFAADNGYKKGQVLWVFRIAVTGAKNTPGGAAEMAILLGKTEACRRLEITLKRL
ncbi:MAG: glutamate--tRNA ligase [Clostridiales bacterium]|nr:glutamate--tRNA ligase [Clostridiales bacterium]